MKVLWVYVLCLLLMDGVYLLFIVLYVNCIFIGVIEVFVLKVGEEFFIF